MMEGTSAYVRLDPTTDDVLVIGNDRIQMGTVKGGLYSEPLPTE